MRVLIVGSGISGATAAVLLARDGHQVEIMESRSHVAGNCYDEKQDGVTVHRYGPHLFHTPNTQVWTLLSNFTRWQAYEHRVLADTALGRISIPYSKLTEQQIGKSLSDDEIVNLIFREYSEKQWGVPFAELPAAIRNRVPTRRDNFDDRYFTDTHQGQPAHGYTEMFRQMLNGIPVVTGADPDEWRRRAPQADLVIYTGKLDEYFHYSEGRLPYRSLRFETSRQEQRLENSVINQCNCQPNTRVYDHSWFLDERVGHTFVTKEYPEAYAAGVNDPYYPMPFGDGLALSQRYKEMAAKEKNVNFLGRLATYAYLDMWMAVAQTMTKLREVVSHDTFQHFCGRQVAAD